MSSISEFYFEILKNVVDPLALHDPVLGRGPDTRA